MNNTNIESQDKKRGGQPGNQNARTHDFYSHVLTPEQQESMEQAADIHNLDEEIGLMRLKILSILANDPDNHSAMLMAVSMLTKMLKANFSFKARQRLDEPVTFRIVTDDTQPGDIEPVVALKEMKPVVHPDLPPLLNQVPYRR